MIINIIQLKMKEIFVYKKIQLLKIIILIQQINNFNYVKKDVKIVLVKIFVSLVKKNIILLIYLKLVKNLLIF